ncbi:MAG TPA: cytochrome c family protein [Hyphomicrobium sp.]|nr:cytochrome c family protein [Hyphomicrobium sp.]
MDSFEFTKIAGAVLSALLLIIGTKVLVEARMPGPPAKPGYTLPVAEAAAGDKAKAAEGETKAAEGEAKPAEGESKPAEGEAKPAEGEAKPAEAKADGEKGPAAVLADLSKASADNGKTLFSKCKACHTIEKGKPKGVGPNLWGVVNRPKASAEGFDYSPAMKEKGGNWTFEDLAAFISNPKGFVPGTKMVFNGLPNPADAADLIAYLATQSDTPAELPK